MRVDGPGGLYLFGFALCGLVWVVILGNGRFLYSRPDLGTEFGGVTAQEDWEREIYLQDLKGVELSLVAESHLDYWPFLHLAVNAGYHCYPQGRVCLGNEMGMHSTQIEHMKISLYN